MVRIVAGMKELFTFLQDYQNKVLPKELLLKEIGEVGFMYLRKHNHLIKTPEGWKVVFK
jgi:hypothetical protein